VILTRIVILIHTNVIATRMSVTSTRTSWISTLAGFLRLFVTFFEIFCDVFLLLRRSAFILHILLPSHWDSHKCNLRRFIWLFCDCFWLCLFLYFTSVFNRLTYIGFCTTNILSEAILHLVKQHHFTYKFWKQFNVAYAY
jgi:hypothetical protein